MLIPLFVKKEGELRIIDAALVTHLCAKKNYIDVFLSNKTKYLVRSSMSAIIEKLPSDMFVITHRSYIVSIYHIDKILKDHLHIGTKVIPIGRQYYKSFMAKLNILDETS